MKCSQCIIVSRIFKHVFIREIFVSLLVCCALVLSGHAQNDSLSRLRLDKADASLFLFTAGYRMPLNKNAVINSGHGIYLEGGINAGRFISRKLVVGFYGGWAFMDRLWNTSFNQQFSNDLNNSVRSELSLSPFDSSVVSSGLNLVRTAKGSPGIIPGCAGRSFHNYSLYYGIVVKLPFKYLPVIKFYTGTTRSHLQADGNTLTRGKEFNIFELRRGMYGCELILFKGFKIVEKNRSQKRVLSKHAGAFSIYCETSNYYKSSLYFYDGTNRVNISLERFVTPGFLSKYKSEVAAGFKLSFFIM